MSQRNKASRNDVFVSPEELDAETYRDTRPSNPELNTGRVVAKPLVIHNIWADVKQPRRAVPGLIRVNWDGNPAMVQDLLNHWLLVAEQKAGKHIPVVDILNGRGEGFAEEDAHPYVADFIKLLRLAQSVHTDGLINPITVIKQGARYVIEGGERRWLAHHLLVQHIDKKYEKIPVIEGNAEDALWRQAHENNNRDSLNAIAKARQLALLIMDLRRNLNDYQTYEELVEVCDRIYYAQVANGRIHSIPPGMSERVESAMGLTIARVNQYRSLLRLTEDNAVNDILWLRASDEWWAEGFMRDVAKLPLETLRGIVLGSQDWTQDDLRKAIESTVVDSSGSHNSGNPEPKATPPPKELLTKGTIIQRDLGDYWQIEDVYAGGNAFYCASPTGYRMQVAYEKITAIANDKRDLFKAAPAKSTPDEPRPSLDAWYGVRVQSPGGQIGVVKGVNGASLRCRTDSGEMFDVLPSDATPVDKDYQPEGRVSVDVKTGKVTSTPVEPPAKSSSPATPTPQTSIPKDKFGVPILEGATVKTRTNRTGRVTGYNGRHVIVSVNGLKTDHLPDTLEVVPTDTFIPTPEEKAHIESFLDGDRVRLHRPIGGLSEFAEGVVKVWDDGERGIAFDGTGYYTSRVKVDEQRSHILLWCELLEDEEQTKSPVYQVGDEVYVTKNERMKGTIRYIKDQAKPYGVFLHHSGSTHYYDASELSPLVEASETVNEPINDSDLLSDATLEMLSGLIQAARACEIQEWVIIEDLCTMNREKLREVIGRVGIAAVEKMVINYSTMTKDILTHIESRFNDHLQQVHVAALEIAKGDK